MARLEFIQHEFFGAYLNAEGGLSWEKQHYSPLKDLPQIFWEDGSGWNEANLWALQRRATRVDAPETVKGVMKHLKRYADYLESRKTDWRHFPIRREDQVLRMFRKHLIDDMASGLLAPSTASNCMNAVIQFYRFADSHDLVMAHAPMWRDRLAVIPYFDAAGFKRSMVRLTTDLKIPNRARLGLRLEDGLLPLRAEHMSQLLAYTAANETAELHLMLSFGFFTGARVGTVTTLTVSSLETAREDPFTPGLFLLPVGPGTGIDTKFSVKGSLIVPREVLDDLKRYASSTPRLLRQAKAHRDHKDCLFLTRRSKPYTPDLVSRLILEMRQRAVGRGLYFLQRFHFHQSRATFGTWLAQLLLDTGLRTSDVIRFIRDAMLHKEERTTLTYIQFIETSRTKEELAAAFNNAFTGLCSRSERQLDA
ncbi:site-specific integrase [Azoarcus sp. L1K30]|uniref:tyrosine-type recombinase/integrase n=1 Tax=Azoarcus sp. L1K30 TaxID=2820277 RepID=UPI001B82B7B9|nr:site-specific integrase [Azoarcus sp. L1K30]MBR0568246.1 site-specific integrase [Azoarcus sp. L1K30]